MQHPAGKKEDNTKSSTAETKSNELEHLWGALRGNDAKYRTLFEKAGDAIFFLEAEGENTGRIIDANHCAAQMHGYTRKELIGKNIRELDGPDDAGKAAERIRRMAKGEWIRTEAVHRKKDGSLFFVEISAGIIHLDDTPFILAFDRDISQDKKTRDALEEQLTFFQTLIDTIPSPIFYKDETGVYLGCNKAFERFIGLSGKEVIGKSVFDVAPKDLAQKYKAADDDLFEQKGTQVYEASVKYADGAIHDVIFNKAVFSKKSGELGGMVGVMLDITDRKKTEIEKQELRKKLYQAQKMEAIGNLSAGIAHDFNNILSGILGSSQLLNLYASESPKLKNEIEKIISGTHRAAELVRQILSFSRQTETEKLSVRVSPIVQEALKLIRASMPSFINIDTRISSKSRIMADPGRIHQLIMNLCTNACHAMAEEGGTLRVIVRKTDISDHESDPEFNLTPDKFMVLEISDTGCGISQEHIDRIFEPYFSTNSHKESTGLGLSIVHAVVKEHQGHIKVISHQDKGSLFKVYFPIVKKDYELPNPKGPEISEESPGTELIMIVDDEDYILSSTSGYLEDWGYRTCCFSDGAEAWAAFKADPTMIDLLITDMTMPGLKGNELARQIQALKPGLPVILCSGHRQESADKSPEIADNLNFFQKPVDLHTLTRTVRKMLDKKKGHLL